MAARVEAVGASLSLARRLGGQMTRYPELAGAMPTSRDKSASSAQTSLSPNCRGLRMRASPKIPDVADHTCCAQEAAAGIGEGDEAALVPRARGTTAGLEGA